MKLLGQTKEDCDQVFGTAVMTSNLLGDVAHGEKAWEYGVGAYRMRVGFYAGIARYAAFQKNSNISFEQEDLKTVLSLIGAWSDWKGKLESGSFDLVGKDAAGHSVEAHAWHNGQKRYLFAWLPALDGQAPVTPDKTAVDAKF